MADISTEAKCPTPARKNTSGFKKSTKTEKRKMITLHKQGLSINQIGAIVKKDPSTVYRNLLSLGIDTTEFKGVKSNWSDINLAGASKLMDVRNRIVERISEEDINAMDGRAKCTAAYQLSLATGATIDQAPKVQVNIQVNVAADSRRIAEIEQRLEQLRGGRIPDVVFEESALHNPSEDADNT